LVLVPVFRAQLMEVMKFSVITARGDGGFGSTGA
jgi:dUTPase